MKPRIHSSLLAVLGMVLLSAAQLPTACAETTTLLSDDFSLNGIDRTAGTSIGGVPIQYTADGSVNWVTIGDGTMVLTSGGALNTLSGDSGVRVSLPSYDPRQKIAVQTKISFNSIVFSWTAVGFQRTDSGNIYDASNALALLQPTGADTAQWTLFGAGTGNQIGSGTLTDFDFNTTHTFALTYDPNAGTYGSLSLWVDGVNVSGAVALTATNQITSLANATIFQSSTAGSTSLDDFFVTQPNPPPQVLLSDDFSLSGTNRVVGAPIEGIPVQHSSGAPVNWVAIGGNSTVFTADGALKTPTGSTGAKVALPFSDSAQEITAQADIKFSSIVFSWTAVGFQRTDSGNIYDASNALGILVPAGANSAQWALFGAGTGNQIGSGTLTGFDFNATHTIALTYDPNAGAYGSLNLWVDGVNVSGSVALTATHKITSLANATFFQNGTAGSMTLDNFLVTQPFPPAHTLISDDCPLIGANRVAGAPIGGVSVQYISGAPVNWVAITATGTTVFTDDGRLKTPSGDSGARVALPTYNPRQKISTHVDIKFDSIVFSWTAVGFQRTDSGNIYDASNALALLQPTGANTANWYLFGAGTGNQIGSGTLTGFDFGGEHTLALTYDPNAGTYGSLSLWVDGINLSGNVALTAANQITSLANAAFFQNGTAGSATLDNFLVTQLKVFRNVSYVTNGHWRQRMDLHLPASSGGPLMVFIHGGGWVAGDKHDAAGLSMVGQGYAVATINYRYSTQAIFPAQIQDCKAAIRWLRAHAAEFGYDPSRLGVWGASAGGHLTALLATTGTTQQFDVGENLDQSSAIQCGVDMFGPTDLPGWQPPIPPNDPQVWRSGTASIFVSLLGGSIDSKLALAAEASPLNWAGAASAPLFMIHGDSDPLVKLEQSQRLYDKLDTAGAEAILRVVVGGAHGGPADPEGDPNIFWLPIDGVYTQDAINAFLKPHLWP